MLLIVRSFALYSVYTTNTAQNNLTLDSEFIPECVHLLVAQHNALQITFFSSKEFAIFILKTDKKGISSGHHQRKISIIYQISQLNIDISQSSTKTLT